MPCRECTQPLPINEVIVFILQFIPCIHRIQVYQINQSYIQSLPKYDLVHLSYVEIRCLFSVMVLFFIFILDFPLTRPMCRAGTEEHYRSGCFFSIFNFHSSDTDRSDKDVLQGNGASTEHTRYPFEIGSHLYETNPLGDSVT